MQTETTRVPTLIDRRGITALLDLSRQRVQQLHHDLPEPVAMLSGGYVWVLDDIVRWAKANGRQLHWLLYERERRRHMPESNA